MAEKQTEDLKARRTFDSAYGFSFSIAVGLLLFIAGLVISLTVGEGTTGLIFGIPYVEIGHGFGGWGGSELTRRK